MTPATHGLRRRAQASARGLLGPGGCSWATTSSPSRHIYFATLWSVWLQGKAAHGPMRGVCGSRPRRGAPRAAVFWIAIANTVELSLHLGLYAHLCFSAHAAVSVLLPGSVFVFSAIRSCVVWTPLPGVLLRVNNRIHSLCIDV